MRQGKNLSRALDRQNDSTVAGSMASGRPYSRPRSTSNCVLYNSLHSTWIVGDGGTRKEFADWPPWSRVVSRNRAVPLVQSAPRMVDCARQSTPLGRLQDSSPDPGRRRTFIPVQDAHLLSCLRVINYPWSSPQESVMNSPPMDDRDGVIWF